MKPKRSCESCRQRHRRCIIRPDAIRCNGCDEMDKECTLSPNFQFRPSRFSDITHADWGRTSSQERDAGPGRDPGPDPAMPSQTSSTSEQESVRSTAAAVELRGSISSWPPASIHTSGKLTQREAFLYRLWVQKIALISDALDDERHFAVTVSRLALEQDVLLNGILGLASRFDRLANGPSGTSSDIESAFYHGRCMELLIELLNKPAETYDATLVAAVVLSRLYEENDTETDSLTYHLAGTSTLLGHEVITRLATKGGLAEAACWVHLRQAIYISIVHRRHLDIPLRVYENLTAFRKADDTSYGNRAVYLLARIVLKYFPERPINVASPQPEDNWQALQEELDLWFKFKPVSFNPIYFEPPDPNGGEPFPRMWMASTVATFQHYYSSQIIINLYQYNNPLGTGFEATKAMRNKEKFIASSLCVLMGLALSNEQALNAWYLPCHMLQLCGYVLRNHIERSRTIEYLETVKQQIQWKTAPLIDVLTRQWAELDGYEIEES
ncbi:hypothetical protein LX32DRAFT_269298 [Colletotrichum zoysiae]|uniref:Zn(2)-C6 fungal-type domain-containing protein n=1 Tax=Colletotrichum zoysiae TaxID=1216348 RepID=A0AAD9H2I5_9PEZI|nr:hypothetical protein LX32DRAFT_269298 [Colletotrichum zoysiae]